MEVWLLHGQGNSWAAANPAISQVAEVYNIPMLNVLWYSNPWCIRAQPEVFLIHGRPIAPFGGNATPCLSTAGRFRYTGTMAFFSLADCRYKSGITTKSGMLNLRYVGETTGFSPVKMVVDILDTCSRELNLSDHHILWLTNLSFIHQNIFDPT